MNLIRNWTLARKAMAVTTLALCLTAPTQAQDIGRVGSGGNGCPGTAKAVLSPDGRSMKLIVSGYEAKVDRRKSFDRKTCNLTISVDVPRGKRFAVVSATYNVENDLPAGAQSVLRAEYFFPGTTGGVFERTFSGPLRRTASVPASVARLWSPCGTDTILRINSSLRVTSTAGKAASISLSGRRAGGAVVRLEWKNC